MKEKPRCKNLRCLHPFKDHQKKHGFLACWVMGCMCVKYNPKS